MRWGLLSAAAIGSVVVRANAGSRVTRFEAVAARSASRAAAFAQQHDIPKSYGSYEELLASDIDAVYIALPAALHAEWVLAALRAGKHVLCEKPFVLGSEQAHNIYGTAKSSGKRVVEGFMWRLHPQTRLARKLVNDGAIGSLSTIRAALTVSVPADDIRFDPALGGGGLYDLGCYCTSAIRLFGGAVSSVSAVATFDPNGVDRRLAAVIRCASGVLGLFDVGLDLAARRDELELIGTHGVLRVEDPWLCRDGTVRLRTADGDEQRFAVPTEYGHDDLGEDAVYRIEFDAVSKAFENGTSLPFELDDAVDQATVVEAILRSARAGHPEPVGGRS